MGKLNKLYWIKKEIKQIQDEINELTVLSASSMSGMPKSNKISNPVNDFVGKKIRLQDKLLNTLDKYIDERDKIEEIITKIEDVEIRVLARKRFIDNKEYYEIAREEHMDRSTVYRKLKKYLGDDM